MSKHAAYTPRHRGDAERPVVEGSKRAVRKIVILSAVAVAGTGTAVAGGVAMHHGAQVNEALDLTPVSAPAAATGASATTQGEERALLDRRDSLSRSDSRARVDPLKTASLSALTDDDHTALSKTEDMAAADPKSIAAAMMAKYGWNGSQFSCLVSLWTRESNWNVHAANPSGAYGIPQSLPGSKMASAGPDWQDNAETQIAWGLEYIRGRYGTPCGAWGHSEATNWY